MEGELEELRQSAVTEGPRRRRSRASSSTSPARKGTDHARLRLSSSAATSAALAALRRFVRDGPLHRLRSLPARGTRLPPAELRGAAGLTAALIWCAVLALLLGGSIFTRDLTENRLAFDFRLPVRPGAIWAASLLAAIVTITLAAGLVLAPSALVGMDLASAAAGLDVLLGVGEGGQGLPAKTGITFAPLAILALLLLANPVALASRARQAWAGVDMISFALIGFAGYWSWQTLRPWEAHSAIWWTTTVLVGATFVGTTVASLLQVARGRTETDRAQKRLSTGLLATAMLAAGATTGYSQWLVHPNLNDLVGNEARAQSLGPDWVVIQGPTRSRQQMVARFLVAPALGGLCASALSREIPEPASPSPSRSTIRPSPGWNREKREPGSLQLYRLSTDARGVRPRRQRPRRLRDLCVNWVLSPDGALVAALEMLGKETDPMRLVVSRLATGDVVAVVQFPHCRVFGDMLFASDKEVLIPCGFPSYSDVQYEYVHLVRVNLVEKTTRDERYDATFPPALDASLGLMRTPRGWLKLEVTKPEPTYGRRGPDYGFQTAWRLRDYDSGRVIAELAPPSLIPGDARVHGSELRGGTLAMAASGGENQLSLYSAIGGQPQTISLGGSISEVFAESSDSETILVGSYTRHYGGGGEFSFVTIEIRGGTTRPLEKGLHPAGRLGEIGSTHSVLYNSSGRLLWFNPQSKAVQPLLGEAQYF